MSDSQRVMILSVGAGNGHNRAAQALEKAFLEKNQNETVRYIDCLDFTNEFFKEVYADSYIETVKHVPALWGYAFEKTDVPWKESALREWFERENARPLIREILSFKPSLCICTHFMPAVIISQLIAKNRLDTHLSVVVTDYYVHATWLTDLFCRYFVANEECKVQLQALGFPDERVSVSGIPIDPVFQNADDAEEIRHTFDLDSDLPVILLSAGAMGVMSGEDIVRMMRTIQSPAQAVIICGRNDDLRKEIENEIEGHSRSSLRIKVTGFTTEMDRWMTAADLFIGKPGGLTTSECLAKGLPLVIWNPIPGQEMFNAEYLLENGAAVAPSTISTLGYKIDKLLADPGRIERMQAAAKRLAKAAAASEIRDMLLANSGELPVKIPKRTK